MDEKKALKGGINARRSDIELLHGLRHLRARLLDVVLHAIEQRALVDDEHAQVLEQLGELRDGFGDLGQFAVARAQIGGDIVDEGCGLALALVLL